MYFWVFDVLEMSCGEGVEEAVYMCLPTRSAWRTEQQAICCVGVLARAHSPPPASVQSRTVQTGPLPLVHLGLVQAAPCAQRRLLIHRQSDVEPVCLVMEHAGSTSEEERG